MTSGFPEGDNFVRTTTVLFNIVLDQFAIMNDEVSYTMAASKWRRSGHVEIVSVYDTVIASFPIDFLKTCGDNTWQYILHVVAIIVELDPVHPGSIFFEDGVAVDYQDIPMAGRFRFLEQGLSILRLVKFG